MCKTPWLLGCLATVVLVSGCSKATPRIVDASEIEEREHVLKNTLIRLTAVDWEGAIEGVTPTEEEPSHAFVIGYEQLDDGGVLLQPLVVSNSGTHVESWKVDYTDNPAPGEIAFSWCEWNGPLTVPDPTRDAEGCKIFMNGSTKKFGCDQCDECTATCEALGTESPSGGSGKIWCLCQ